MGFIELTRDIQRHPELKTEKLIVAKQSIWQVSRGSGLAPHEGAIVYLTNGKTIHVMENYEHMLKVLVRD